MVGQEGFLYTQAVAEPRGGQQGPGPCKTFFFFNIINNKLLILNYYFISYI